MTNKITCHHYTFVVLSKLQAFLLYHNLCFTKNPHILQSQKLKIIGHIGKTGMGLTIQNQCNFTKKAQTKTITKSPARPK